MFTSSTLLDDGDDGEAIDDEDSPQWMDNKLKDVVDEEVFQWSPGSGCQSGCMVAPELEEILADAPRASLKGEAKAVETVVEDNEVSEDEDAALNWGA
jgi:hypothetical protein